MTRNYGLAEKLNEAFFVYDFSTGRYFYALSADRYFYARLAGEGIRTAPRMCGGMSYRQWGSAVRMAALLNAWFPDRRWSAVTQTAARMLDEIAERDGEGSISDRYRRI